MLYEYARYKGYDVTKAADLSGFADQGSVSAFAVGPMQWAVAHELIFGVGGIIAPFVGIKIIDILIHPLLTIIGF